MQLFKDGLVFLRMNILFSTSYTEFLIATFWSLVAHSGSQTPTTVEGKPLFQNKLNGLIMNVSMIMGPDGARNEH
jgi:hypothetical protein